MFFHSPFRFILEKQHKANHQSKLKEFRGLALGTFCYRTIFTPPGYTYAAPQAVPCEVPKWLLGGSPRTAQPQLQCLRAALQSLTAEWRGGSPAVQLLTGTFTRVCYRSFLWLFLQGQNKFSAREALRKLFPVAGSLFTLRGTKPESFFSEISGTSLHLAMFHMVRFHFVCFTFYFFLVSSYHFGVKYNVLPSSAMREKLHYNCKIPQSDSFLLVALC